MAFPYPYVGPIAPYNNLPIAAYNFLPSQFFISAITLGQSTTVTMTKNHNYVIGQQCRLVIPEANKSYQLNEQTGFVTSIPAANQVILNIDSSQNVNAFVSTSLPTQPQIMAIGDINTGTINTGRANDGTFVPGSFINISA